MARQVRYTAAQARHMFIESDSEPSHIEDDDDYRI